MAIETGDVVAITTKQPVEDIWKVMQVSKTTPAVAKLKGLTNRCIILCPVDQLAKLTPQQITKLINDHHQRYNYYFNWRSYLQNSNPYYREETPDNGFFHNHGSILHIDGAEEFVERCKEKYKELGINANAYYLAPPEIPDNIESLLKQHNPDILVITGHDGLLDKENPMSLQSYQYSKDYYNATKKAREYDRDKNSLIIFSGACGSFFETLIQAGANFASSPQRVNIDIFDPVFIAEKISKTPFLTKVNLADTIGSTQAGFDGIGGMESIGKSRLTIPKLNDFSIPNNHTANRNHPFTSSQYVSYQYSPRFP